MICPGCCRSADDREDIHECGDVKVRMPSEDPPCAYDSCTCQHMVACDAG